ncbi:MAG TPA: hypothetical protein VMV47_07945 [Bacteroidales bacterium]|nr:hypothetical protein [Bacteroidales bacterium]
MRLSSVLIIFCILISFDGFSQDFIWKARVNTFFDNNEFGKSEYKVPQTMSGVQVAPEYGLRWDSSHIVSAGINLLHEFGSSDQVDKLYLTAYYEFNKHPYRFLMGAFPRDIVLDKYPRIFFQDSIGYYRPNINGIFWEVNSAGNYLNLWLDWTSQISETVRETFFIGMSGRYNMGIIYLQHFDYMFHYAKDLDPVVDKGIYDNAMIVTSAGIDLRGRTFLDVLDINVGWASGIERARADESGWIVNNGLLMETRFQYKLLGIINTLYIGERQMAFYNDHSNNLYWGDPIYRAGNYNRTDLNISFIRNTKVNLNLTYSLHFAEGNVYHEQMLKASINLNNY